MIGINCTGHVLWDLPKETLALLQAPPQRFDESLIALPPFGLC